MPAYTLDDVARICRVSPARLRYWERTALIEASRGGESRLAFGFDDLVSIRQVTGLLDRGVPLRRIRRSLEALRERLPDLERPLGAMQVWESGPRRVVVRYAGSWIEPEGQLMLDFAPEAGEWRPVARLAPRPEAESEAAARRRRALEWFERGCQLDEARATLSQAIDAYRRAIEADPGLADAHCNLGSVYYNLERRALARACYERALELEARHVEANLNLGSLLEEEGRNEAALRHYKLALSTQPLHADAHVSLALLYEKLDLRRTAREHWRRYLQVEPSGAWADLARRRLRS